MKKTEIILTFILVFLSIGNLNGQTFLLSDFVETTLPKPKTSERSKIYEHGFDFVVNVRNGKLKIKEYKQKKYIPDLKFFTIDGMFLGTDSGECGGRLNFINNARDTTTIKTGNIRFLFRYNREIYFIESLAHGTINEGALYKIVPVNNAYSYEKIVDFDDAPMVMCIVEADILVASANNFYKIHELKKEKIFPDLLADDLSPRSLVAEDSRHVYMGLTGGYVHIDLTDSSYQFFQFKKEQSHE